MTPELGDSHQIVDDHCVRHVPFVQDFVESHQFISMILRPRRMICHPIGKLAVEGLGLRKPNPAVRCGIFEGVFHRLQKAGVIEYWITISNVMELNHLVAYHFGRPNVD